MTNEQLDRVLPVSNATNVYELLDDVKRVVREEPKRLRMHAYLYDRYVVESLSEYQLVPHHAGKPECGTVGCIAGWMNVLTNRKYYVERGEAPPTGRVVWDMMDVFYRASDDYTRDVENLFHNFDYEETSGTPEYAEAICARIDKFQEKWAHILRSLPVKPLEM